MNRKADAILIGIFSVAAVLMGLWFMGAVSFANKDAESKEEEVQGETEKILFEPEYWEIVYGGMKFTIASDATAYIHESGCLNINLNKDYLIQLDIEEETIDDFWEKRESKLESVIASGYRLEHEPERITIDGREYIRYVLSMESVGEGYNRVYLEVLLTPADSGRRFLICVKYDGIDMEKCEETERTLLYDEALETVAQIMNAAVLTDEKDDEAGSLWMPDISGNAERVYLSHDSLDYRDEKLEVAYDLPEGCCYLSDGIIGKNYLAEEENIHINISVWENTSKTAEEKALSHSYAGFSKIHTQGQVEVQGRIFYYYTYSVMRSSKESKKYSYNFIACCDLKNGDVYEINGWAQDNEEAMDSDFYLDMMNITEITP